MTLSEFFLTTYAWAVQHREVIAVTAALIPVVGTVAARLGKAGRTDADGRVIASVVVGVGVLAVLLEIAAVGAAYTAFDASLLAADALLVAAPVVCFAGCLLGIRWVFPLSELASVRTLRDVGIFLAACAGLVWFFSKFRGWGIFFVGGVLQLVVLLALTYFLLRRLLRRAFARHGD
ncbi:MAG TPA: hypothetical protein VGQ83_32905 [Polyangia bacterium]|jgi:hypothetical protein